MTDFLVVFNDILQSREPAVMIKPAFRVAPQSRQRRRAVHVCRRTVRLERIHTHLARSMKIVPWFRIKRRHVANRTFSLAIENFFSAFCRLLVKAPVGWLWCRDRQLVEVQRGQLRRHPVRHAPGVPRSAFPSNWILLG